MSKTTIDCKGCAYATQKYQSGCAAFSEKPKPCWNHTTPREAARREREIKLYSGKK